MDFQLVILAGGKGTRIKSVIGETPKILALIKDKPFLDWLLIWIKSWNIKINKKIIISTCIGHEAIIDYCIKKNHQTKCIKEVSPLGTFGALANVATKCKSKYYIVINGDTIFRADFKKLSNKFLSNKEGLPLILLRENSKINLLGGYKKINNSWLYSKDRTRYISLGAFFISYEELKSRWCKLTSKPFNNEIINQKNITELMIDSDCFGSDPISAHIISSDLPFIDIGIPSDFIKAQTLIPDLIKII